MPPRSSPLWRLVPPARRLVIRTGDGPLRRLWVLLYVVAARAGAAYLTRGERDASVYARSTYRTESFLPGLSDVDLAIVVRGDPGPTRSRWRRLDRRVPLVRAALDWPRIFGEDELRDLGGESVFTFGLHPGGDTRADRAAYQGGGGIDAMRALERPGLYGETDEWRLLRGPDRRPPRAPEREAQATRLAAWSELIYFWRIVFRACVEPPGPLANLLAVKLVAETARIWLWLAHRERTGNRADVLTRASERLPEEKESFARALALERSLTRAHEGALAQLLPVVVRLSTRIATELAEQVAGADVREVRLVGADPPRLVAADPPLPGALPLCDWRALAYPPPPDESFAVVPGDPGELATLVELIRAQRGRSYAALRADAVLVLPTQGLRTGAIMVLPASQRPLERARQRAIKSATSDPVTFALAEGSRLARFPEVAGWSARDVARRAVAEHRAWLRGPAEDLALLLTAARAARFLESLEQREPELLLTVTETAERLGAERALEAYRAAVEDGATPPSRTVDELRRLVRALPAYA